MSGYTSSDESTSFNCKLKSEAQPVVVVAIARRVVVAIGNATVDGIVVPTTTTKDTIRAQMTFNLKKFLIYDLKTANEA